MKRDEAIKVLGIFLLKHKDEVISLINRSGLGALTYDTPQLEVNEVVVANLDNKMFINELDEIVRQDSKGYLNDFGITAIITIAVAVISMTATIWNNSVKNQRAMDQAIYEGRRDLYLNREQQKKLLLHQNGALLKELQMVQLEYLNEEEQLRDEQETEQKQNIAVIVGGGMIVVAIAIYLLRK